MPMDTSTVFKPVRELSELLRTRRVSPVELTELSLERLETLGSELNAVVTITRDRALRQARRAEEEIAAGNYRGPLHGVPYGVKDLVATAEGIPTTWGATPFREQIFDHDATVVRKLDEAGAVLVAKLAMVELAGGMGYLSPDNTFSGPGITPWGNRDSWAGGSSSGSASAVSAGIVPFAIGSETWGSILTPANNCGIAGLRPTYGRVSRYGAMALSWTLDKLGPLCLTADDCGLVLEAIAGPDANDPTAIDQPYRYNPEATSQRFKLGVLKDVTEGASDEVKANFSQALSVLEQVADIEEVEMPDLPYDAVTRTILNAEFASAFEEFLESGKMSELTSDVTKFGSYARHAVLAKDYIRALRIKGIICKAADDVLSRYDALVAPSRPDVATPIDQEIRSIFGRVRDRMGAVGNVAGLPSISVPNGFGERGLPTGIQFMSRAYEENGALAAARAYQGITDWHQQHPPGLV